MADSALVTQPTMEANDELPELVLPVESRDNCFGSPSAKYSLVEYGDYTDPRCRDAAGVVRELMREMPDDLCVVFRNFPQPALRPFSRLAAEAAEAGGLQGKFWMMHDRLFDHQDELSEQMIREIARGLPIELADFERDLSSGAAARRVDEDVESATDAGVGDTPTFFINGRLQIGEYEFVPLLDAIKESDPSRRAGGA